MSHIYERDYPLFYRMSAALFPGIDEQIKNEENFIRYILDFYIDSELDNLRLELNKIHKYNFNDQQWSAIWYGSRAATVPKTAIGSEHLIMSIISEIDKIRK